MSSIITFFTAFKVAIITIIWSRNTRRVVVIFQIIFQCVVYMSDYINRQCLVYDINKKTANMYGFVGSVMYFVINDACKI